MIDVIFPSNRITLRANIFVIGLPLFSGTSFPECPPSPMLPHPMSENSCDSHSLARNTSTGTFLKTQATTWTKQLQKNENSATHFPQLFSPKTTSNDKDQTKKRMHEKPKNHNEVKRAHEESSHEKKSLDARK